MGAAKATFYQGWEKKMGELKNINEAAYDWLVAIPRKSWYKHGFSCYPRCDVLMNNLSESFNSSILLARDKPIITMMEWIRSYIMSRFASLRDKLGKYPGVVMPKPRRRLDKEIEKSGNWIAVWAGDAKFEVTQGFTMEKFIVDLSQHTCSCYYWDLVGIPCRHVMAAIHYKVENPEHYVQAYYKRDAYAACYDPKISPINGQQLWPKTNSAELLPPLYKTPPGRPKKLRIREHDESGSRTKLSKQNISMKCTKCNQYGHNIRSCRKGNRHKKGQGQRQTYAAGNGGTSVAEPPRRNPRNEAATTANTRESGGTTVAETSSTTQPPRRSGRMRRAPNVLGSQASTNKPTCYELD